MTAVIRLIAFVVSALGVEVARGAGLATLAVAVLAGAMRFNPFYIVAVAAAGSAVSLALPEDAATSGKVAHGLSNAPFVVMLHLALGGTGYAVGRTVRRLAPR